MNNIKTQPESAIKPRIIWVDFLRVVGSFLVVLSHVDGWGGNPSWASTFYTIISRNAVPLFFMVSGFLLLSKQESIYSFLKKRAWKILIPFFAWSIYFDVLWNGELLNTGVSFTSLARLFIRILRGTRAPHLWFLYTLIGLYIFIPILRIFIAKAKKTDILYFIGLWIIVVPVFAIIQFFTPLSFGFELQFASGYIGYFLLGTYLGQMNISKSRYIFFATLFSLGFLSSFLIIFLNIPPHESVNENVFRSYLSLNIIQYLRRLCC